MQSKQTTPPWDVYLLKCVVLHAQADMVSCVFVFGAGNHRDKIMGRSHFGTCPLLLLLPSNPSMHLLIFRVCSLSAIIRHSVLILRDSRNLPTTHPTFLCQPRPVMSLPSDQSFPAPLARKELRHELLVLSQDMAVCFKMGIQNPKILQVYPLVN